MADIQGNESVATAEVKEDDGVTWWCKLLVKVIGVVAAIVSIISAVPSLISVLQPLNIVTGSLMVVNGILLLIFEAPVCCQFIEQTKSIAGWIDRRKYWQKGIIYLVMAVIPLIPSRSVTSFLGCVPVFATGVFYGLLSLGKKADRGEMMANAQSSSGNKYLPFQNEP